MLGGETEKLRPLTIDFCISKFIQGVSLSKDALTKSPNEVRIFRLKRLRSGFNDPVSVLEMLTKLGYGDELECRFGPGWISVSSVHQKVFSKKVAGEGMYYERE